MNLEQKLEAILFFKGESISIKKLASILEVSEEEIKEALQNLKTNLENRGIILLEKENEVMLGTHPEMAGLIENLQKEELNKELSKSSLETLSIVLYKNGVSRSEIDYIRGVNSSFILRALSVRGLIEKSVDPKDTRKNIYKPTFELLSFMGVRNVEELPDYATVNTSISSEIEKLEEEINNEDQ
ncbi:MAG: SMC-Scp complex subunit ScpB [Patescibacteria group bacterium]